MKKIAYLHLGLEKCASSSIQFLLKNSVKEDSVIFYLVGNEESFVFNNLPNEIYISDERLSWENYDFSWLVEKLKESNYEIFPFFIFRNPLNYISSLYFESLKWGETATFNDYVIKNLNFLNYKEKIRLAKQIFGFEPHIFWLSPSIISDVFNYIKLPIPNDIPFDNKKLDSDITKIIFNINNYFNATFNDKDKTSLITRQSLAQLESLARENSILPSNIKYQEIDYLELSTIRMILKKVGDSGYPESIFYEL
jgi:hypothetical protein